MKKSEIRDNVDNILNVFQKIVRSETINGRNMEKIIDAQSEAEAIDELVKKSYRNGYAAGNATKNYHKSDNKDTIMEGIEVRLKAVEYKLYKLEYKDHVHRYANIMFLTDPPQRKCLDCGELVYV